ncbi:MAG TPA: DUF4492 domain-containing protein [Campylobacteraceae bacterium]|jgi:hypothetical protein|nr:DUF4492 domain-containing protein [Campylobacteraceae bacterium]
MTLIKKIYAFYRDGFAGMRLGKKLWAIVIVKLFLFFVVIKLIFFPNILKERFADDKQRTEYIINNLISGGK